MYCAVVIRFYITGGLQQFFADVAFGIAYLQLILSKRPRRSQRLNRTASAAKVTSSTGTVSSTPTLK